MVLASSLVGYLLITVFFFGQLARVDILGFNIPLIDPILATYSLLNLVIHLKNKSTPTSKKLIIFLIISLFSLIYNLFPRGYFSLEPLFHFIRLSSVILLLVFPPTISNNLRKHTHISIFANVLFGLIQYLYWPDFTNFKSLNWDPHLYRLVSTYFDPTFTGLIFLLFLIKLFSSHQYFLLLLTYLAIALTYSRSTLLSLLSTAFVHSITNKNIQVLFLSTSIVLLTIFCLPRLEGEGTKLERTSSIFAKIENLKEAITIYKSSPLIGVGYNNLQHIRNVSTNSHSKNGFDSSLMTILTTTGSLGIVFFVAGIIDIFKSSNLEKKYMLVAILTHSLFANSLLYPWTIITYLFI